MTGARTANRWNVIGRFDGFVATITLLQIQIAYSTKDEWNGFEASSTMGLDQPLHLATSLQTLKKEAGGQQI